MIRNDLPKSLVDNPELGQWVGYRGAQVRCGWPRARWSSDKAS